MLSNSGKVLESNKIIGSHNVQLLFCHKHFKELGIHNNKIGSALDECMTLGLSLSLLPKFVEHFCVINVIDIVSESERIDEFFKSICRYLLQC